MKTTDLPSGIRAHTLDNGEVRFEARVHRSNAKPMSRRFKTVQEASTWKNQADALIEGGIDPRTVLGKKKTLDVRAAPSAEVISPAASTGNELSVRLAVENYLAFRKNSHNALPTNAVTDYRQVASDLGDFPVASLRNEDLAHYITLLLRTPIKRDAKKLAEGTLEGAPRCYRQASVRKFIYALKIALDWNAKNGKANLNAHLFSFARNTMPSAWAGKRDRRLYDGEEDKLYASAVDRGDFTYNESDWRAVIGFALESAMREQEIILARWIDILPTGHKLHIPAPHTKTKTSRTILLSKKAREIISKQRASCPKDAKRIFYQFPNAQALGEAFARLRERAQIKNLHFHDLRHEATSRLCESGQLDEPT